jgi:hypothetical protein
MKPAKRREQLEKNSPEYMEDGSYISSSGRLDFFHVALYPNLDFFEHKDCFGTVKLACIVGKRKKP